MKPFDARYYARHYGSKSTRVHGKIEIARLASGIFSMFDWWGAEIRTVFDVGAGTGLFRDWVQAHRPRIKVRSLEFSAYAAERYGHELGDIANFESESRFDLVFCQGVLPYLDDGAAKRALKNLGALSAGFLYLEAITQRDLIEVCDQELTDTHVYRRTGAFYRRYLQKDFTTVGAGLYYHLNGPLQFYELETAAPKLRPRSERK
jgi:SAM-dependent methyltransferase